MLQPLLLIYLFLLSCAIDFILKSKSPCFRCCVRADLQSDAEHRQLQLFCQLRFYAPIAFCPMSSTEAARFRFRSVCFYDVPLPLQPARLLPGPSKAPGWESSGEIDRNKVCVIKDHTVAHLPREVCEISVSNLGFKRSENQQRRGGVSQFVRSAVDFLRLTTGEFSFSHSTQPVLHTSCLFGNSLVTTNLFFGTGSNQTECHLLFPLLFLFVSSGDKNKVTAGTRFRS